MDLEFIAGGAILVIGGGILFKFPHNVRNFVSSKEWQVNPEQAKRKQEFLAKLIGTVTAGLGTVLLIAGIL